MESLIDKANEFIHWLENMTDFGDWSEEIRGAVHHKLIEILISDRIKDADYGQREL